MIDKNLIPNATLQAIQLLNEKSFEAYLVGGSVRDLLSNKVPHDFDIATSASPKDMEDVFHEYQLILVGKKYGTVTVIIDNSPLEITTYRLEENYSDHRRPDKIYFTNSLKQDLSRRDFTINSLAYHPDMGLINSFSGLEDLNDKIIRTVGNPEKRFAEDALRILRALRFASVLDFKIDKNTSSAIHKQKNLLHKISIERINQEFRKLLIGQAVERILLDYRDVFTLLIPEIKEIISNKDSLSDTEDHDSYNYLTGFVANTPRILDLRLSALYATITRPELFCKEKNKSSEASKYTKHSAQITRNSLLNLKFEKKLVDNVSELVLYFDLNLKADEVFLKKLLSKVGSNTLKKIITLQISAAKTKAGSKQNKDIVHLKDVLILVDKILNENPPLFVKDLVVDGKDALRFGLRGPDIGQALEFLLVNVLEGKIENQREPLLDSLKSLASEIMLNNFNKD